MGWEGGGGGWGYWMRWQTALCFLITVSPAIAAVIVLKRRRSKEPLQSGSGSASASAPCFRGVPPLVLPVYRGLVAVAMGRVFYAMLRRRGLLEFYFYTQWTFVLVITYFLHMPVGSIQGKRPTRKSRPAMLYLYSPPTLVQIIYHTCAGAVMLTDVVFWCLLVPFMSSAHFSVNLLMGCMHSLNLLFLLVDTFLNSMPFPWFGMAYFILWSCTYVIFQWILRACGFSWWPYPFLELASPWAPLWYFCMALIHVPCYGIYWLIVKAKNTYFPRLFPHSYVKLYN